MPRPRLAPSGHHDVLETARHVAAFAVFAKPAVVDVIAAVAGDALRAQLCRITGAHMAGRTDQTPVAACQRKACRAIMIELPGLPVRCRMTVAAGGRRSQCADMVPVIMTIGAGGAFCRERPVCMTAGACHLGMISQQRKTCEIVIESDVGLPVVAVVAAPARLAQLSGVCILGRMARSAFGRRPRFAGGNSMAGFALCQGVPTGQRKAGHRVVVEVDRLPCGFHVAAGAILAVAALMRILCRMTAKASGWRLGDFGRLLVAPLACGCAMRAFQCERCHPVMIEADLLPAS